MGPIGIVVHELVTLDVRLLRLGLSHALVRLDVGLVLVLVLRGLLILLRRLLLIRHDFLLSFNRLPSNL